MSLKYSDRFREEFQTAIRFAVHVPDTDAVSKIVVKNNWFFRSDLSYNIPEDYIQNHDVDVTMISSYISRALIDDRVFEDCRGNLFCILPCFSSYSKAWKLYLPSYLISRNEDKHIPR